MNRTTSQNFRANFDYQDLNNNFYKFFKQWIKNKDDLTKYQKISKKCQKIQMILKELNIEQKSEWAETIYLKCKQLQKANLNQLDQLIEALYILVKLSNAYKINYNSEHIHQIIKNTYYDIYKQSILELFKQSKFSIQQFEVLYYQDSWLTKIFKFFLE